MKRILFFSWFILLTCVGVQAQTTSHIINQMDETGQNTRLYSIISSSDIDNLNARLDAINASSPYNVTIVFNETAIRATKSSKPLSVADFQEMQMDIRKANKKHFNGIPTVGTGANTKKNIAIYYNFRFFNKPDKDVTLENFFQQTVILNPAIKTPIKTGLSALQQTSKLISGQDNLSNNADYINNWIAQLEKLIQDSANSPDDNYQFGPLIVTIPANSATLVSPAATKSVDGILLKKYVCTTASTTISLKSNEYTTLHKTLSNLTITYFYDESGTYDEVKITMGGQPSVDLADINLIKAKIKDVSLMVTSAGAFSGLVLMEAPITADVKINTLFTLKPGFGGTFKFNYTSGTQDYSGTYDFSGVTNVKIDIAKFDVSIGTIQGNLDATGKITQQVTVANKVCDGTFYTLEFTNFTANVTYGIFTGLKLNSGSFDGAVSSLVGISGKLGVGGNIDASGNIACSVKQENTNLSVCGAAITNLIGGIALSSDLDFKFFEGACSITHSKLNSSIAISKLYIDPQGIAEFDGSGNVEYESFTFSIDHLSYSQADKQIVCSASLRINVTGTDANLNVSDFRIKDGDITVGEVSGRLLAGNFIDAQFVIRYTNEDNFSRFSGYYEGELMGDIKVLGALDVTHTKTPVDFYSCYVKLAISTQPGRGIPLGPLPVDIYKLSGEFGYNYRIDFTNMNRSPDRPGTPTQSTYIAGLGVGLSVRGGIAGLDANPIIQISTGTNTSVDLIMTGQIKVPAEDEWFSVDLSAKYQYPANTFEGGIQYNLQIPKNNGALVNAQNLGLDFKLLKLPDASNVEHYYWYLGRRNMSLTLIRVLTIGGDLEFKGRMDDMRSWSAYLRGTAGFDFQWSGSQDVQFLSYNVARASAAVHLSASATCSLAVSKSGVSGMLGMSIHASGSVSVAILPDLNLSWNTFDAAVLGEVSGSVGFVNTTITLNGHLRAAATVAGKTGNFELDLKYTYSPTAGSSSSVTSTSTTYAATPQNAIFTPGPNTFQAGDLTAIKNELTRRETAAATTVPGPNPFAKYRVLSANLTILKAKSTVAAADYTTFSTNLASVHVDILKELDSCDANVLEKFYLYITKPNTNNFTKFKSIPTAYATFNAWLTSQSLHKTVNDDADPFNDFPALKSNLSTFTTTWGNPRYTTFTTKLSACGPKVLARLNGISQSANILQMMELYFTDHTTAPALFAGNISEFEAWLAARAIIPNNIENSSEWLKYAAIKKQFPALKTKLGDVRFQQALNSFLNCGPTVLASFTTKIPPYAVVEKLALDCEADYTLPTDFKTDITQFNTWYGANKGAVTAIELADSDFNNTALLNQDSREKTFTELVNAPDEIMVLSVHGSGSNFVFMINGDAIEATPRTLANYLSANDLDDDKILLLSCSDLTAAKNLSNKLNQKVIATDGVVRIYSDGGVLGFTNGQVIPFVECQPGNKQVPLTTQPRGPSSQTLEYVDMGGVIDEVQDLLNRDVNINNLSNPPTGYQFFILNGRKYIKRIDTNSSLKRLTVDENDIIVEYDGSQRISVPGNLAKNLGTAPSSNHQAHHLIPDAVVRTHWFYVAVRARQGNTYDLDRASNGIYMATAEEFFITGVSDMYPTHTGSHPEYTTDIINMINGILNAEGIDANNFSQLTDENVNQLLLLFENNAKNIVLGWPHSRLD